MNDDIAPIRQQPVVAVCIADRNRSDATMASSDKSMTIGDAATGWNVFQLRDTASQMHDRLLGKGFGVGSACQSTVKRDSRAHQVASRQLPAIKTGAVGDVPIMRLEAMPFYPRNDIRKGLILKSRQRLLRFIGNRQVAHKAGHVETLEVLQHGQGFIK